MGTFHVCHRKWSGVVLIFELGFGTGAGGIIGDRRVLLMGLLAFFFFNGKMTLSLEVT